MGLRALGGPQGESVRHSRAGEALNPLAQVTSRKADAGARSWGKGEEEGICLVQLELRKALIFK